MYTHGGSCRKSCSTLSHPIGQNRFFNHKSCDFLECFTLGIVSLCGACLVKYAPNKERSKWKSENLTEAKFSTITHSNQWGEQTRNEWAEYSRLKCFLRLTPQISSVCKTQTWTALVSEWLLGYGEELVGLLCFIIMTQKRWFTLTTDTLHCHHQQVTQLSMFRRPVQLLPLSISSNYHLWNVHHFLLIIVILVWQQEYSGIFSSIIVEKWQIKISVWRTRAALACIEAAVCNKEKIIIFYRCIEKVVTVWHETENLRKKSSSFAFSQC